MSAYGFHNFQLSFWKSKMKFLLASKKSLTNCEIPSSNHLQRACSGFLIAACAFKSCSETRLWFWKLFRKQTMKGMQKYRHLTKFSWKGTLRQVFICLRPRTTYPPQSPPLNLRVEPERWGEGQQGRVQITKLGTKYQYVWKYARNWLFPVNSDKHLPQCPFFRSNF
jgi:hypothetical protein